MAARRPLSTLDIHVTCEHKFLIIKRYLCHISTEAGACKMAKCEDLNEGYYYAWGFQEPPFNQPNPPHLCYPKLFTLIPCNSVLQSIPNRNEKVSNSSRSSDAYLILGVRVTGVCGILGGILTLSWCHLFLINLEFNLTSTLAALKHLSGAS